MASSRRTVQLQEDTWDQLYVIKGPRRTFDQAIKNLLQLVYPPEHDDKDQTKLEILSGPICPACRQYSIIQDEQGDYYCQNPSCQYEPEESELQNV
jgi:hypothetical protein